MITEAEALTIAHQFCVEATFAEGLQVGSHSTFEWGWICGFTTPDMRGGGPPPPGLGELAISRVNGSTLFIGSELASFEATYRGRLLRLFRAGAGLTTFEALDGA